MLYSLHFYCETPWRWSHEYRNLKVLTIKDTYNNFVNVHFVGLCMNDSQHRALQQLLILQAHVSIRDSAPQLCWNKQGVIKKFRD